MAQAKASAEHAASGGAAAASGPDLSRLRIARDAAPLRRRARRWPFVAFLLVLAGGGYAAWKAGYVSFGREAGGALREVVVGRATRIGGPAPASTPEVKANGYVIARRRAALSTVLSGRLVEVNVEEGDEVKANQVVARIQSDDYEAARISATKAVEVARRKRDETQKSLDASRLDLARLAGDNDVLRRLADQAESESERAARDVERNRDLRRRELIDEGEWDRIQSVARSAAAALEAARTRVLAGVAAEEAWKGEIARREAALATQRAEVEKAEQDEAQAKILVEKTYVRAPWDGLVVHKDAEVGEVVAATGFGGNSRGSVATIVDVATLEVQVELPETRLGRIAEGDATRMVLDAEPSRSWAGRVRQVWPTADRQKATVEMRIEFVERPPVLKPEMGVRVEFVPKPVAGGAEPGRVFVPRAAVVERDARTVVFAVAGGTVRRVEVVTGKGGNGAPPGTIEVDRGLSGGEAVVLDPPADLADGERVRIATEEAK